MEKKKPHYSLAAILEQMIDVPSLKLTESARTDILFVLGWNLDDALGAIRSLTRKHFYKSMTTSKDHRVWQDVYHARWRDTDIYLKFKHHESSYYFTVSFKEK